MTVPFIFDGSESLCSSKAAVLRCRQSADPQPRSFLILQVQKDGRSPIGLELQKVPNAMTRRDEPLPWTEDEDYYLSQGYAIYHDEKTNAIDFARIKDTFPFREGREVTDLSDRWRELTDRLETEHQETIERIKSQSKSHRQTWTYKYEPQPDLPPVDDILSDYVQMPSLAMKAQFTELGTSRFISDTQNINEMCLNFQFEAGKVNSMVREVLEQTVDDETLRSTLLQEFQKALVNQGRAFAKEDIERKLSLIGAMPDHALADTEGRILMAQFERIFALVQARIRQAVNTAYMPELLTLLLTMQRIQWPSTHLPNIEPIWNEFKTCMFRVIAELLKLQQFAPNREDLMFQVVDGLIAMDPKGEFDMLLDVRLRSMFAGLRSGKGRGFQG
jgi:hypothetical protein